ncbi:MAG: translational GTPase TypA [Alphaproteobacteria bacterium]|nr:translational GTPase TypA [Alphaproteobacteria bacterium]
MSAKEIRNIAIIAHVDHGKTTLTDALMKQCGAPMAGSMDSNVLEQERGITIYAKNTSITYNNIKINIVDTPGHSDFGSEVERVLRAIDSVLLLVDAQEGPMPQTRFVLKKSLELGLKPIVVINKIDKPAGDAERVQSEVFDLFFELGANNEQLNFVTVYAIGREGVAMKHLTDERKNLTPLIETILEHVPPASGEITTSPVAQVFNLAYDNFLGRLAVCRVYSGTFKVGDTVHARNSIGKHEQGKIIKLFTYNGIERTEAQEVFAGDICVLAGIANVYIGDTVSTTTTIDPLPMMAIDEPTISLNFLVNDSPFRGKEGKFVTTRQIRDRLEKELEVNVGLKVDFSQTDSYLVYGRGELHISVLLEQMRREGFEVQVSQPQVIIKQEGNKKSEPFEEVIIDVPTEYAGAVIEKITKRRALLQEMKEINGAITRIVAEMPTRGLLGYRGEFVVDTKGLGILSSRFLAFKEWAGVITKRDVGSMISMAQGKAAAFSLWNLQERGTIYIEANSEVYEGQIIGNTSKGEAMEVNPTKGKQLTNVRGGGADEAIVLTPPWKLTIERGLEIMQDDEYLEITPQSVRLRKKYLTNTDRARAKRG